MNHSDIIPIVPKKIDKLMREIIKLQSFTTINAIEIELQYTNENLIKSFSNNDQTVIQNNTIVVNFGTSNLSNILTVDEVLLEIYKLSLDEDIIDGILIRSSMRIRGRWVNVALEITNKSEAPTIISIDHHDLYYEFMNILNFEWYSSKI